MKKDRWLVSMVIMKRWVLKIWGGSFGYYITFFFYFLSLKKKNME